MKFCKFMIVLLIMTTAISCSAQKRIFSAIPSGEGIEKVYIGKTLIRMASRTSIYTSAFRAAGVSTDAIKNIEAIEVLEVENKKFFKNAKEIIDKEVETNKWEVLMTSDDGQDETTIYGLTKEGSPEDTLDAMMIVEVDSEEIEVVVLWGKISPEALVKDQKKANDKTTQEKAN